MSSQLPFSKENPFLATIKERRWLSKPGSERQTFHIVLDLNGSGYSYTPGDSVGIFPVNSVALVEHTLAAMGASGDEEVFDRHGAGPFQLRDFLTRKANLGTVSRKLLSEIVARKSDSDEKKALEHLFVEGQKDALSSYLEQHQLWDLLRGNKDAKFTPQELASLMMPLLPRLYSIASAQSTVGNEVHLTVSKLNYVSNAHERFGVCTQYLCDLAPSEIPIVPVYIQPHHGFTIPDDKADIIMIGPGTGVAPYRAFMQERIFRHATGRHWLFFGEWRRAYDYFYEEEWLEYSDAGLLTIETAFSRDQEHKIYVQHLMESNGEELYRWLESGAYIYVCGDLHHMAKDVDAALHRIVQKWGNQSEQDAKAYVKALRNQKRYLRDIY